MMPSKVSDLLPLAISQWFTGRRRTDANGSVPAADTPERTPEREPERTPHSPPAKRARYEPSASITNYYAPPEVNLTPRVDEPLAGPSGYRPEPPAQLPPAAAQPGRAARPFWPELSRAGDRSVARLSLFHGNENRLDETGKKVTPTTPTASKRPAAGSPFYRGKTMYGGAAASGMYLYEPNVRERATAVVAPPLCDADVSVSSTTRHLMALLERCAAPLSERPPPPPQPQPLDTGANASLIARTIAPAFNSSKYRELNVSHLPTLLKLKQGARLRESTRAARLVADAHSPVASPLPYPAQNNQNSSTPWPKQTNKMKSQVGRNPARKGSQISLETETVPPLNLPTGVLSIDPTNLPKISFAGSSNFQVPKTSVTPEKLEANTFKFSKPTEIDSQPSSIPNSTSRFTFSKPEDITLKKKIVNGPQKTSETNSNNFGFGIAKPVVKENGEAQPKTWKCDDCWVVNKDECEKCIACGGSKPVPVAKLETKPVPKDWQCKDCWIFNKDAVHNCIACGGTKPVAATKTIDLKTKASTPLIKDWQCKDCWVFNKDAVNNCIACGCAKPVATSKPLDEVAELSAPIVKDWRCKDCWVSNKADVQKCIACGGSNNPSITSTPDKAKEWKCPDCWVMNKDEVMKCIACGGSKPTNIIKSDASKDKDWQCKNCWVSNKDISSNCVECGGSKPNDKAPLNNVGDWANTKVGKVSNWTCNDCWVTNDEKVAECVACGGLNPKKNTAQSPMNKAQNNVNIKQDTKFTDMVKKQSEQWECPSCLARNNNTVAKCVCCEAAKPGAKINEESAKFQFPATPTSFKFGIPSANSTEADNKVKTNEEDKSTKGILNVDSSKTSASKTVTFTFGIPKPATEVQNKSTDKEVVKETPKFSFGTLTKPQETVAFKLPETTVNVNNKSSESKEKTEVDSSKFTSTQNADTDKDTALTSSKVGPISTPITFNYTSPLGKSAGTEKTSTEATLQNSSTTLFGITPNTAKKPEGSSTLFSLPTSAPKTTESASSFFGVPKTSEASSNLFGGQKNSQGTSTFFGMPANASKSEGTSTLPGMPANSPRTSDVSSTLFGVPKPTTKTSEISSTTLFGMPPAKTTEVSSTLFGIPSSTAKTTEGTASLLVTLSNTAKTTEAPSFFGMPSKPAITTDGSGTLFGMPTTTAKTSEASSALFSIPTSATKKPETTSSFVMPSSMTKSTEGSPNLFGMASNPAIPSGAPTLFGVPSNAPKTTDTSSLAATTKPPMFPASSGAFSLPKADNSSSQTPAPLFSFGSTTQEPAKPATPSRFNFSFGGTSTEPAAPSFNATFGSSTTQQTSNPNPAPPSFTLPNNNMFGAQPQSSLFGTTNTQADPSKIAGSQSKPAFSFGSSNTTLFGSQTQPAAAQNATLFGSAQTQPSTMFGAAQTANKPTELFQTANTNLFAAQPASNAAPMGMFGTSSLGGSTFGAASNPSGALGMSSPLGQAAAPLGQPPAFNFGATSTPPMFGFGQQAAAAPQQGIYSFGAVSTPGVQFSLGTSAGSPQAAAPGARRVRKAVRRTLR